MKAFVFGLLVILSCTACCQEEPVATAAAIEVEFREEDYVLEMHDVADLLQEGVGEPPICLVETDLVEPDHALTAPELIDKALQSVGPAGQSTFAHFEVHRGILIVSLPQPEQAVISSLIRNLRRSSSLFVEYSVTELSEAEALQISPEFGGPASRGVLVATPELRERIEAVRAAREVPLVLTGVASGWTCLRLTSARGQAPLHGLHVLAVPSPDRNQFDLRYTWDPARAAKSSGLSVQDRGVFLVRVPGYREGRPFALAIQPRLVALRATPLSGPGPRVQIRDQ